MHPELFKLGPVTIYSYGLFVALGFFAATLLAGYRAKKAGLPADKITDLNIYSFLAAVLGARLLYILTELKYYRQYPEQIWKIWEGGLVFYGGLIGGLLFYFWYTRRQKLEPFMIADLLIPGVALGQALGRLGCFFRGCCYGVKSEKYGVIFPDIGDNLPHLPTQLFESAATLCIFILLMLRKPRYKGELLILYLLFYSSFRFMIEFLRADERGPVILNIFSVSQVISLGIAVAAVIVYSKKRGKQN